VVAVKLFFSILCFAEINNQVLTLFCENLRELFKEKNLPVPSSDITDLTPQFTSQFVNKLRELGYPVGIYSLINKSDVSKIPLFLTKTGGILTFVKKSKNGKLVIYQGSSKKLVSKKEFLQIWKGERVISPFVCNLWYICSSRIDTCGEISIIYSYHDVTPQELTGAVKAILEKAEVENKKVLYVDELGLIPYSTIRNYMEIYNYDEKQAFEKCKKMLKAEVKNIEKGITIYDPNPTYSSLYKYLAENKIKSVLEDLDYDNWKGIVRFDTLNTDILAQEYFLRGNINEYMKFKKLYCFGFWEYNVKRRDRNFVEQLKRLISLYPDYKIFTIRGIGHFGLEEKLAQEGINIKFILLGDGLLEENLINQQVLQVDFNHHVHLPEENIFRMLLESEIEELLRVYFYKKTKNALLATQQVRDVLGLMTNEDIFRIFTKVKEKVDRNFSSGELPELIYNLVQEAIKKGKSNKL